MYFRYLYELSLQLIETKPYADGIDFWFLDYGSCRLYAKSRGSTYSDRRD
jgi:hypothetical protein